MPIKIFLKLRKESPPHLSLPKFLELLKRDEILSNESRAVLMALRKAHATYVPLPLEHEFIVSREYTSTYHRDLKPVVKIYTKNPWSINNLEEYDKDKVKFVDRILALYSEMGYEYEVSEVTVDEVTKIEKKLQTLIAKAVKKIHKLKPEEQNAKP